MDLELEQHIGVSEAGEYWEAKRRGLLSFERFTTLQPPSVAAEAIIGYWRSRVAMFKERAWLEMDQTGKGALNDEDLLLLRSGVVQLLSSNSDAEVLCMDSTALPGKTESLHRVLFYMLSKLTMKKVAIVERVLRPDDLQAETYLAMLTPLALELHSLHLLFAKATLDVLGAVRDKVGDQSSKAQVYQFDGTSNEPPPNLCNNLGLTEAELPASFGGKATLEQFQEWQAKIIADETSNVDKVGPARPDKRARLSETVAVSTKELISLVGDAVRVMVDTDDKQAYLEARRRVPHLVKTESDPLRFLRMTDFKIRPAAEAVARYWERRRECFAERAYLPLDLTGRGALNEEDIDVLRRGPGVILPNDRHGRSVLCFERSRIKLNNSNFPYEARTRAYFYLYHLVAQNPLSQTEGAILLRNMHSSFLPNHRTRDMADLAAVSSVKVQSTQLIFHIVPGQTTPSLLRQTVIPAVRQRYQAGKSDHVFDHIWDPSVGEPPEELLSLGLRKEGIPDTLGGAWSYEKDLPVWFATRLQIESAGYSKPAGGTQPAEKTEASTKKSRDRYMTAVNKLQTGLEQALERYPAQDKTAYMKALKADRQLVEQETPLARFAACHGQDLDVAARRLVGYWGKRMTLFGRNATLPMSQTIEGTLSRSDVEVLVSSALLCLPQDARGRMMVFFDSHKAQTTPRKELRRVAFYMLHVASERHDSVGFVLPVQADTDVDLINDILCDLIEVMPCRLSAVFVLCTPSAKKSTESSSATTDRLRAPLNGQGLVLLDVTTRNRMAAALVPHGMRLDDLPMAIGGGWGVQRFLEWQELRTRYEWGLPPPHMLKDANAICDFSSVKAPSELSQSERAERTRRLNKLHSRRKRERDRIEMEVLQEQVEEWKSKNVDLFAENTRLEALLASAEHVVAHLKE